MMRPMEVDVTVQVDEVQSVPDGFGFHLKASEYTWITLERCLRERPLGLRSAQPLATTTTGKK